MVASHRAVFRYHPTFGYFFRTNLHTWQVPQDPTGPIHLITTNSVGARCRRDPHRAAGAGAPRVMFVGCSLAAGDGVSNGDRFTDVLETLLPGVEGHNYALSGSGHDQQLLIHREFADMIQPDALVVCPSLNCIGRNLLTERLHRDATMAGSIAVPKPYFTLDVHGTLVPHHIPVPKPEPRPRRDPRFDGQRSPGIGARVRAGIGRVLGRPSAHRNATYDDVESTGYRLGHALLATLLGESGASVKLVMPLLDFKYATERWTHHHGFFASLAAAAGASLVDIAAFFRPLSATAVRACFSEYDGHYTRAGHEVIAAGLAAALQQCGVAGS